MTLQEALQQLLSLAQEGKGDYRINIYTSCHGCLGAANTLNVDDTNRKIEIEG